MYESLHNHTTLSDGSQSHLEVLETAQASGFGVIAFTDHDVLPNQAQMLQLTAYEGPTRWFIGCEVSCGMPRPMGAVGKASMHMLGLFVDVREPDLQKHCDTAQIARRERILRLVGNLQNLGFVISVEDVMAQSDGESIGRPHIVQALATHSSNQSVMDALQADMARAAQGNAALVADYADMCARPFSIPYRLFLSDDAFIPGVYVDYLYFIDMDQAVRLIRGAGGVAVLAHWYTVRKHLSLDQLELLLVEKRLDGVEIQGNPDNPAARDAAPKLRRVAEKTGALMTYGVDGHRADDIVAFAAQREVAEQTVGQTRRLIRYLQPDLRYSNLAR